jgi:hypothetical protein
VDSSGVALDWSLPLVPHVGLSGEAFLGENLLPFQAGAFQGVNPDFVAGAQGRATPRAIRTRGGWAQLGVTPGRTEELAFYATYGIDDPDDADLVSAAARDWRSRNRAWAASILHKPSPLLSWGVEVRRVSTLTTRSGERTNTHVNLGVALSF